MPGGRTAQVAAAARAMHAEGLVSGAAGNVSARGGGGAMLITPTRTPYPELTPAHVVTVTFTGDPIEGEGLPSSESLLHGAIYAARPDVRAIVHAHPIYASALAARREPIPAFMDEQVIHLGGAVEVSAYAPAASDALAANAVRALGQRRAVLLANHGTVTVGSDPADALEMTRLTERLARIWIIASSGASARRLPDDVAAAETELYLMRQQAEHA